MRHWRRQAKCWGSKVDFHNEKSPAKAKGLCGLCPVQQECRDWAVKTERRDNVTMNGIWGGMTAAERREQYPLDKTRYRQAERRLA